MDQLVEDITECFDLFVSADGDTRISIRGGVTTVCIVDIPPPITAECLLNQTRGVSPASVSCSASNVPPDTLIEVITCEIDGTPSDICKQILILALWSRTIIIINDSPAGFSPGKFNCIAGGRGLNKVCNTRLSITPVKRQGNVGMWGARYVCLKGLGGASPWL